jgi:hypothetical protein
MCGAVLPVPIHFNTGILNYVQRQICLYFTLFIPWNEDMYTATLNQIFHYCSIYNTCIVSGRESRRYHCCVDHLFERKETKRGTLFLNAIVVQFLFNHQNYASC